MATIKDVARRAGVSPSTVSRALSGKIPVEGETKARVMKAVKELNYHPNILAKGLKEGRTNTIALVIPNIQNPVFPAVARGVEDIARKNGFTVILCNTDEDLQIEKEYVDKLQKRWVDGFIFATATNESTHILKLIEMNFPVVLLLREMKSKTDAVVLDNFKGAYKAVTYLAEKGHTRIAMVNGNLSLPLYKERYEGYKKALQDKNIVADDDFVINEVSNKSNIKEKIQQWLKSERTPDAIFAASDPKAIEVIRMIKDFGLQVPEDISIIGFDNLEISALIDPPLSTVSQPLYKMGAAAANKLIKHITSKSKKKPVVEVMEPTLIIRKSIISRKE